MFFPGKPLRYLILALTLRCSLKCVYCYNGEAKDAVMADDVLEKSFELLKGADAFAGRTEGASGGMSAGGGKRTAEGKLPFHVQLTGGEPALVPDRIEAALKLIERFKKQTGRTGTAAVQTNGLHLDGSLIALFKKYSLEVGLSLDGPPEINERQRGGTAALLKGLELLNQNSVPFNVTAVVTAESAGTLSELLLLLSRYKCVRGLALDLLVNRGRGGAGPPAPSVLFQSAAKLKKTLVQINRLRSAPIVLRELELLASAAAKPRGFFCEAHCGMSLAVSPDGSLWPCGQPAGEKDFSCGTVFDPHLPKKTFSSLFLPDSQCGSCALSGKCPGECPSRLFFNSENSHLIWELYRGLSRR